MTKSSKSVKVDPHCRSLYSGIVGAGWLAEQRHVRATIPAVPDPVLVRMGLYLVVRAACGETMNEQMDDFDVEVSALATTSATP